MNKKKYILEHVYEYEYGEGLTDDEVKFLGAYSSEEKAKQAIDRYFKLPGFNKHSKDCFQIGYCEIDVDSAWTEGFLSGDEASGLK